MTETIYEGIKRSREERQEIRLPNNRRQIGSPKAGSAAVFLEDYAVSYAQELAQKDYTGCAVGVLVGECLYTEEGENILVQGVLEVSDVLCGGKVCFTEENWSEIYRDVREYFPEYKIVGWFLGGPGFLLEDGERHKKIQADYFGGEDKIFLRADSIEKELMLQKMEGGEMKVLPGYYIFYDKNLGMQNYMMEKRQPGRKREEEKERFLPRKDVEAMTVATEAAEPPVYRLLYATGGVVACLALFVIGALAIQINEQSHLKQQLSRQEQAVSSFCESYVVKEGETIEDICRRIYGEETLAVQIRILNGLEEKENPEAGEKIWLP